MVIGTTAVLAISGAVDLDLRALGRPAAAERLEGIGDVLVSNAACSIAAQRPRRSDEPRRCSEREHTRAATGLKKFATASMHGERLLDKIAIAILPRRARA